MVDPKDGKTTYNNASIVQIMTMAVNPSIRSNPVYASVSPTGAGLGALVAGQRPGDMIDFTGIFAGPLIFTGGQREIAFMKVFSGNLPAQLNGGSAAPSASLTNQYGKSNVPAIVINPFYNHAAAEAGFKQLFGVDLPEDLQPTPPAVKPAAGPPKPAGKDL